MTDEEVGKYIRLLCYQHQHGHFDDVAMQSLCRGIPSASLAAKFKKDSDGLFYNERLEKEVLKRKAHSEKQRENANKRWQSNGNATAMPLENEIEDVSEIKNEKGKGGKGEKPTNPEVSEIIQELNDLAGRSFEPDSKYVSKHVEARLKEYPKEDLIDMVRLMVYKWKGDTKMDQYLRPSTLFAAENCANYVQEMKGHRLNGTKPVKEKSKGKTLLDPMQVMREVYQYHESKNQ